jgi:hypothetical protein
MLLNVNAPITNIFIGISDRVAKMLQLIEEHPDDDFTIN